ncbi:metallophosphatase family protein [Halosquirtibacter xylanolyticus]|uniref:metallophosphoesterase family protein n=1 Tax=Halosquirtibacter xylanolyticus TaxID=3374599 RepID=UPI003747F45E|nr:metallophosphatase family protein [Prolixibacteraceae bacterium]
MKHIALLSDSHGNLDSVAIKHLQDVDEIWHAGDLGGIEVLDQLENITKTRAVFGNIDDHKVRNATPQIQIFETEGLKVVMTHIGGYPGRYYKGIGPILTKEKPKLFISGHSHILKVIPDNTKKLIHMNPGAIGKHGFHKVRTLIKFEIDAGEIKNLRVIELGARGVL